MNVNDNDVDVCSETEHLIGSSSSLDGNKPNPFQEEGPEKSARSKSSSRIRNLSGFWILGLCNNYGYVIMLSAAFDILHPSFQNETAEPEVPINETFHCNPVSTGAILLADILPALAVKLVAPFFIPGIHFRVLLAVLLSISSFLLTSFSIERWMSFLGVVAASLSSGLGEVTFLGYSSYFEKDVVSTWSSGTGGAGVVGALSYAALTSVMTPRTTLQVMIVMPLLLATTFWLLLVHPSHMRLCAKRRNSQDDGDFTDRQRIVSDPVRQFTVKEKLTITRSLLKYMLPLALVYFAEYFINQGLFEIIFFQGIWLSHSQQYRWYQVVYQVGVLISRSSVNFVKINRLWILPIVQGGNAVLLTFVAYYGFVPWIWIVFAVILFEGLMGGAAYVNTFYKIIQEVPENEKEFSMSIVSLSDSCGIALAGGVALPVHEALCKALTV